MLSLPHARGTCQRIGACLFQLIFTKDEAEAKVNEEADVVEVVTEAREKVDKWMSSNEAEEAEDRQEVPEEQVGGDRQQLEEEIKEAKRGVKDRHAALQGMLKRKMAFDAATPSSTTSSSRSSRWR